MDRGKSSALNIGNLGIERQNVEKEIDLKKNLLLEDNKDGSTMKVEGDLKYDYNVVEKYITGDQRECLVLYRLCRAPKEDEGDEWIQNNIFHSTCIMSCCD